MKFLVDTHVLLWSIIDRSKLSDKVKTILYDADNDIFVSAISFWEISLKFSLGKLPISGFTPDELPDWAIKTGFKQISLLPGEGAGYYHLPSTLHKDPFDRMLIWQAVQNGMTLISKDRNISQYKDLGLSILW